MPRQSEHVWFSSLRLVGIDLRHSFVNGRPKASSTKSNIGDLFQYTATSHQFKSDEKGEEDTAGSRGMPFVKFTFDFDPMSLILTCETVSSLRLAKALSALSGGIITVFMLINKSL